MVVKDYIKHKYQSLTQSQVLGF